MIRYIDEALQLWAAELHPPNGAEAIGPGGGRCSLAALIDSRGVLIRSTRQGRVLLEQAAEVELLVNRYLPDKERQVVIEHYTNYDSLDSQKWAACGCSRPQYYRRLHRAHESLVQGLINRKRAA